MDIYLIRHGECLRSTNEYYDDIKKTMNPPLTEKGVFQAQKLTDKLSAVRFDRIYTSDLTRALNTAKIVNEKICSEIIITPQFREIDMGDIYTKSWNDYPDIYDIWNCIKTISHTQTVRTELMSGKDAGRKSIT